MINPPDLPPDETSKTHRKREMTALRDLGEELLSLKPGQLQQIPLPEQIRDAIDAALKMTSHGAQRRQKQYIGKLMRSVDATPIQAALNAIKEHGHASASRFRELERWRDRIISDTDATLALFTEAYPQAERTRLRQLARNAQAEQTKGEAPKSSRALFKYLRELTEQE